MKPGMHLNISNADYHASEALGSSDLKKLSKSGAHYQASLAEETEQSAEMRFGSIVHMMILEPDKVRDQIFVGEYNTRRGKDFDNACKEGEGKLICNREEYNRAQECVEAFRKQAIDHPYLNGQKYQLLEGIKEASFYWQDPVTGLMLKARPDNITPTGVITDIKTCQDASPDGFQRAIAQYQYHLSAAHYLRVVNGVMSTPGQIFDIARPVAFAFVCIESKAPYAMATYFLSADSLDLGLTEADRAMQTYIKGTTTGVWEAYPKELSEISVPRWYLFKAQANGGSNE